MGSCISKCRPKKQHANAIAAIQEHNYSSNQFIQDKLVVSQQVTPKITPIINPSPTPNKISPFPLSPSTSSTSSISSFNCTNSTTTTNTCSSGTISSCSSILTSKDRSFSNDFLYSCIKENPHIIRINSIKDYSQLLVPPNLHVRKLDSPAKKAAPSSKQSIPQKIKTSTPQKRVRSNSPTPLITRQKSFRRDQSTERISNYNPSHNNSSQCTTFLRSSPSPSRRFNGDHNSGGILRSTQKENGSKRMVSNLKVNAASNYNNNYSNKYVSSSLRKENLIKPVSPYSNINSSNRHVRSCLKKNNINKETCIHRISSKIDEVAVEEALAQHDSEAVPMEDIDNPLISLDCFIFL